MPHPILPDVCSEPFAKKQMRRVCGKARRKKRASQDLPTQKKNINNQLSHRFVVLNRFQQEQPTGGDVWDCRQHRWNEIEVADIGGLTYTIGFMFQVCRCSQPRRVQKLWPGRCKGRRGRLSCNKGEKEMGDARAGGENEVKCNARKIK